MDSTSATKGNNQETGVKARRATVLEREKLNVGFMVKKGQVPQNFKKMMRTSSKEINKNSHKSGRPIKIFLKKYKITAWVRK